jgi:hypothetical protein
MRMSRETYQARPGRVEHDPEDLARRSQPLPPNGTLTAAVVRA